ncbi:hypothetical protein C2G38_2028443 [Gigaspora rosea]|uniref:tRNA-specific 2-thiouridylase MnmA-like C-terminal domain-containing protein n=1 Tax=Gigaspora rosea TaxID=44941 RepID=A0A397WA98_9GLOM|nr:hypothetical protein C2G38_2028443 [Gigaspora rosea]
MIEDYENGFTPNPDIICNREIKFGLFLDKCLGSMFNAKWFATGKKKKFAEFLKQYLVTKPGDIKTIDGRIIEITHFYFHEALLPRIGLDIKLLAQIRYRQSPVSCKVISRSNDRYVVEFETPQRAIAPGQVVVIWDNNWCLGSGVIEYAI